MPPKILQTDEKNKFHGSQMFLPLLSFSGKNGLRIAVRPFKQTFFTIKKALRQQTN